LKIMTETLEVPAQIFGNASSPPLLAGGASAATIAAAPGILTIDLGGLVANWRKLEKMAVPAECAAVVKADAYGCGLVPVVQALVAAGCKTFFVATANEARSARTVAPDAVIYVLDGYFGGSGDAFASCDARPVIGGLNEFAEWEAYRQISGWRGGAAIHIDTGMNRLGFSSDDAQMVLPRMMVHDPGITLVMSHLAIAEDQKHPLNARQLADFRPMAAHFASIPASLANSSGIFLGSAYAFDLVRPGAALYGVNPTPEADNPMRSVIELKARILQVRQVARGDSVGYGATWTARRVSRIAIVSAGYADGYFRAASARDGSRGGEVVIAGRRCPIAGRISMDLMAVDVTDGDADRRRHFRRPTRASFRYDRLRSADKPRSPLRPYLQERAGLSPPKESYYADTSGTDLAFVLACACRCG
jgi:alanine racemase